MAPLAPTRVKSGYLKLSSRIVGLRIQLPPWELNNTIIQNPWLRSDSMMSSSTPASVDGRSEIVPGNARCSREQPNGIAGST
jgi:hypothetical protein